MKALNHYLSLCTACFLVGYTLPKVFGSAGLPLCLIAGIVLGLTWHKLTGYTINKKED